MKLYLTSECFDLSNLRNVKELLPVQSEDQQAEHSDVLDFCFHLNRTISLLIASAIRKVLVCPENFRDELRTFDRQSFPTRDSVFIVLLPDKSPRVRSD